MVAAWREALAEEALLAPRLYEKIFAVVRAKVAPHRLQRALLAVTVALAVSK